MEQGRLIFQSRRCNLKHEGKGAKMYLMDMQVTMARAVIMEWEATVAISSI